MREGLEDWEFWIALLKDGSKVHRLEEVQFYYQVKDESMIFSVTKEDKFKLREYIMIKHSAFYIQSISKLHSKYRSISKESNKNLSIYETLWQKILLTK